MSRYVLKLPDLGEGTVEAEIVAWRVKPGDQVSEDDVLGEVMTEKAAVELPAPVSGKIISTTGQPGDMVAVGAELVVFETASVAATADAAAGVGAGASASAGASNGAAADQAQKGPEKGRHGAAENGAAPNATAAATGSTVAVPAAAEPGRRVLTSPAIRRRAKEAGIDLRQVSGSGPQGRIVRQDFETYAAARPAGRAPGVAAVSSLPATRAPAPAQTAAGGSEEIKVIGLRRLIAQRMADAKRNIPHFSYVEELDLTELESLRRHLNAKLEPGTPALTYLPFLALALVRVLEEFPQCNAHYDAQRGVIVRYRAVHLGIATQTPEGLKVPVVRDAQLRSLWEVAAEMRRVAEAARTNKATREELGGSTITLTSLGKLGGIASTPIINAPEVAIIGINRAVERPVVVGGAIAVRRMMNLSSSFDHRFVDGYDAAAMIQALKERIEHPATIFVG
ncbi:MAG TPA: dihydrolipoamide acetyltransferase family protein [Steroidobacteraceae bacterium]|jgi:2-oxoisovalerate dehydrogenase E2 component (dihydrolipoyl transacylase)|nr:dihydrolipoamide acetyltransferase family protein [Steroidobacteraceae bacterium]